MTSAFSLAMKRTGAPKKRRCSSDLTGSRCAKRTSMGDHAVPVAIRPARTQAARRNSALWRGATTPPGIR